MCLISVAHSIIMWSRGVGIDKILEKEKNWLRLQSQVSIIWRVELMRWLLCVDSPINKRVANADVHFFFSPQPE